MKFGLEEELIMCIMKTSITQIWMVCHLLPFAKVGQYGRAGHRRSTEARWPNDHGAGVTDCYN